LSKERNALAARFNFTFFTIARFSRQKQKVDLKLALATLKAEMWPVPI